MNCLNAGTKTYYSRLPANSTFLYRTHFFVLYSPGKNFLPGVSEPYRDSVTFGAAPLTDFVAVMTFSVGVWSSSVGGLTMLGGSCSTTWGVGGFLRSTFLAWGNLF